MSEILVHKIKEDRVAHLELNFPEKRNILSLEMIESLTAQLQKLKKDPNIHLLILSGKGGNFCAGGDLRWMNLSTDISDIENVNQVNMLSKMFYTLESCPFPVMGNVEGSVFGGGLGLVALCDIVLAHENSQFCFSELKLALVPSLIAPFVLKKIAASKLRELIFSARVFYVEEAKELGFIHFSGSSKECESYRQNLILKLLSHDKTALKQTKKLFNTLPDLSPEKGREYTVQILAERRKSPEVSKRIQRFLKSRTTKKPKVLDS